MQVSGDVPQVKVTVPSPASATWWVFGVADASDCDLVGRVVGRDPARARQKLPAPKRPPAPKKRGLTILH